MSVYDWKKLNIAIPPTEWSVFEVDDAAQAQRSNKRFARGQALSWILDGGTGRLSRLFATDGVRDFSEALATLSRVERKTLEQSLGGASLGAFSVLGEIVEEEGFAASLMALGRNLESVAGAESATRRIYLFIREKGGVANLSREAQERLKAERGGYAGEYFLRGLGREVFRWSGLLAFGSAGLAGRAGQAFGRGHLLHRGVGGETAKALGGLLGFGAEVSVFVGSGKMGRSALDGEVQRWDLGTLRQEFLGAVLSLGFLKWGGAAAEQGIKNLALGVVTSFSLRQASLLSAVLLSQEVEIWARLRSAEASSVDRLKTGLATVLHLQLSAGALRGLAPRLHELDFRLGCGMQETMQRASLSGYLKNLAPFEAGVLASPASGVLRPVDLKPAADLYIFSQGQPGRGKLGRVPFEMKIKNARGEEESVTYYINREGYYFVERGGPQREGRNIYNLGMEDKLGAENYLRALAAIESYSRLGKSRNVGVPTSVASDYVVKKTVELPVKASKKRVVARIKNESKSSDRKGEPIKEKLRADKEQRALDKQKIQLERSLAKEKRRVEQQKKIEERQKAKDARQAQRVAQEEERLAAKIRLQEARKKAFVDAVFTKVAEFLTKQRAENPAAFLPKVSPLAMSAEIKNLLRQVDFMGFTFLDFAKFLKSPEHAVAEAFHLLEFADQEAYWRHQLARPEIVGFWYEELLHKFGAKFARACSVWRSRWGIRWEDEAQRVIKEYFLKNPIHDTQSKDYRRVAQALNWDLRKTKQLVRKFLRQLRGGGLTAIERKVLKKRALKFGYDRSQAFLAKVERIPDLERWADVLFEEGFLGKNLADIVKANDPRIPFTEGELKVLIQTSLSPEWQRTYWTAVLQSPSISGRSGSELQVYGVEGFIRGQAIEWRKAMGVSWEVQAIRILSSHPELATASDESVARALDWTVNKVCKIRKLAGSL